MPPKIEANHLGFDSTIYPHSGNVQVLITDPATGLPINLMVLPPDDADSLANELKEAAKLARRQRNPHATMPPAASVCRLFSPDDCVCEASGLQPCEYGEDQKRAD